MRNASVMSLSRMVGRGGSGFSERLIVVLKRARSVGVKVVWTGDVKRKKRRNSNIEACESGFGSLVERREKGRNA